jgi:uncharacterized protein (DUF1697 family)
MVIMTNKTRFVALLRGVNVGGRKVSMAELKSLIEEQGFTDVSTLLQSGNVIFEAKASTSHVQKILEQAISKKFSYPAKVFIYSMDVITQIVNNYPFDANEAEFQHYVVFLKNLDPGTLAALPYDKKIETLSPGKEVLYWKVRKGHSVTSTFSKHLSKATYKDFNTVRNLNTLQKIIVKA